MESAMVILEQQERLDNFFSHTSFNDRSAHLSRLMNSSIVIQETNSDNPEIETRRMGLLHKANKNIKKDALLFLVNIAILPIEIQNKIVSNVFISDIKEGDKHLDVLAKEINKKCTTLFSDILSTISPLVEKFKKTVEKGEQLKNELDCPILHKLLIKAPEFVAIENFFKSLQGVEKKINILKKNIFLNAAENYINADENYSFHIIHLLLTNLEKLSTRFDRLSNSGRYHEMLTIKMYDWFVGAKIPHLIGTSLKNIQSISLLLDMFKVDIIAIQKYKKQSTIASLEDYYRARCLAKVKRNQNRKKLRITDIFGSNQTVGPPSNLTPENRDAWIHFYKNTEKKSFEYVTMQKFTWNNLKTKWILYPFFFSSCMGKYFPNSDQGWAYYTLWNYFAFSTLIFTGREYDQKKFFDLLCDPIRWIPEFLNCLFNEPATFITVAFLISMWTLCPMIMGKIVNFIHSSVVSSDDDIYKDIFLFSLYYAIMTVLYQLYTSKYTKEVKDYTLDDIKALNFDDVTVLYGGG